MSNVNIIKKRLNKLYTMAGEEGRDMVRQTADAYYIRTIEYVSKT